MCIIEASKLYENCVSGYSKIGMEVFLSSLGFTECQKKDKIFKIRSFFVSKVAWLL